MNRGARFYKTDFQIHSPRDGQWAGSRPVAVAEGAIDNPAVPDAITEVMEGGKKAFELRRQKYGY